MIAIQFNETLNVQFNTAVSVDIILAYADHTVASLVANGSAVNLSTTANTTILSSPSANGTIRQLKGLSIRNRDILTTELTLKKNVAAVEYMMTSPIVLKAGETLQYTDQSGFLLTDWNGRTRQTVPCGKQQAGGIYFPVLFGPYAYSSVSPSTPPGYRILDASGGTVATYVGRAPKTCSRVMVKLRTCNNSITPVWGEIAVATGTPVMGAGTTLTVRGFNGSNNAIANSFPSGVQILQGTYSNYVDLSSGQTLQAGDDVWILLGNEAATGANVRCLAIPDELQTGLCLNAATRPSLNIGRGVVYTLDGVANLSPQVSVSYT